MDFKDVKCNRNGCQKMVDGHYHQEDGYDYKWYPVIEIKKKKPSVFYYGQTLVEYLNLTVMKDGFRIERKKK